MTIAVTIGGNGTTADRPAWWIAAVAIVVLLALVWFFVDRRRS